MTDIIDPLHADHANLAKLLNALERQLGRFGEGETPDYGIVRGVVNHGRQEHGDSILFF